MNTIDSAITGLMAAQQGSVNSQISYAVAAKQLDAYRQQGDAVASLLDSAVQFSKETGKGGQFDGVA
ncbi:MAG: hypothetical protein WD070_06545 [Pirellulaceae bacterium]